MSDDFDVKNAVPSGKDGKSVNSHLIDKGVAPIIGSGSSYRFREGGYLDLGLIPKLLIENGFSILVDFAVESTKQMCICSSFNSYGAQLSIIINTENTPNRLSVILRDERENTLKGIANLTSWISKRVAVCVNGPENFLEFSETTPHEISDGEMDILQGDSPRFFSEFDKPFTAGACLADPDGLVFFEGRLAQLAIIPKFLTSSERQSLIQASLQEVTDLGFDMRDVQPDRERTKLFLEDLNEMREMVSSTIFPDYYLRTASLIIYRWLFDRNPILLDVCSEVGLQLAFPGKTTREIEYEQKVVQLGSTFMQQGESKGLFGREWISFSQFRSETQFHLESRPITIEAFVKFVRNKLGGGHYDPIERKRWQKDLKLLSDRVELIGNNAMNYQMRAIVSSILDAVDSCGVEYALKGEL